MKRRQRGVTLSLGAVLLFAACSAPVGDGAGIGTPLPAPEADAQRLIRQHQAVAAEHGLAAGPETTLYVAGRSADLADCSQCHQAGTPPNRVRTQPGERAAHWEISLDHAPDMTCAACHLKSDPAQLQRLGGHSVEIDHAYASCAVCHQDKAREWAGGAHGKRLTGWSETRIVNNCTACHSPHSPAIASRWPVAQPTIVPERLQPAGGSHE